ncbi:hypothetical protein IWX90DRAFT_440339 [Phyllosticta citrichinensis]|uniref:Uncharacterized protein n=1 Tax=Phyllosticta citrichinensis TaxID=1130410 RepID=A0ABR1XKQ4_9PEZI
MQAARQRDRTRRGSDRLQRLKTTTCSLTSSTSLASIYLPSIPHPSQNLPNTEQAADKRARRSKKVGGQIQPTGHRTGRLLVSRVLYYACLLYRYLPTGGRAGFPCMPHPSSRTCAVLFARRSRWWRRGVVCLCTYSGNSFLFGSTITYYLQTQN